MANKKEAVRANLAGLADVLRSLVVDAPVLSTRLQESGFPLEGANAGPTALGRLLDVHRAQIGRWVSGESTPSQESAEKLVELAHLFGLPSAANFCSAPVDLRAWFTELNDIERRRLRLIVGGACLEVADAGRDSFLREGAHIAFGDKPHIRLFVYNLSRDEHGRKRIQRRAMHLPFDKTNPYQRACHVWSEDPKTRQVRQRIGVAYGFKDAIEIIVPEPGGIHDRILLQPVSSGDDTVLVGIASGSFAASETPTIASSPTLAVQPLHFGGDTEIASPGCVYWLDEDWPFFHQVRSIVYSAMTTAQEELVFAADRVSGRDSDALLALGDKLRRYDRGNPEKIKTKAFRPIPRKELTEVVPVPLHVSTGMNADLRRLADTTWIGHYVIRRFERPVIRRLLMRVKPSRFGLGYSAKVGLVYPGSPSDEEEGTLLPYGGRLLVLASPVRSAPADPDYYEAWPPDVIAVDFGGYAPVAGVGLYLSYLRDDRHDAAMAKILVMRQRWPERTNGTGHEFPHLTITQDCAFDGFDRIVELLGSRRASSAPSGTALPGEHMSFFSGWSRSNDRQKQELEELVGLLRSLDHHLTGERMEA